MSDFQEPSIEATADEIKKAARVLHDKWQQPPTGDLVVPPPGVWSKVEAARSTYQEIPVSPQDLPKLFSQRFIAKEFRKSGAMGTSTAHAFEIARKSGLFGRYGESIEIFADESIEGSLLVMGIIWGAPHAHCFEIAREGKWSYEDLIARQKALEGTVEKPAPRTRNLTRDLVFWVLMIISVVLCIAAVFTKLILLGIVAAAIFLSLGGLLFFTKFYRST